MYIFIIIVYDRCRGGGTRRLDDGDDDEWLRSGYEVWEKDELGKVRQEVIFFYLLGSVFFSIRS